MTVKGTVKNGNVILDRPGCLLDGTPVSVRLLKASAATSKQRMRTLYEGLKPFIGMANGLPPDASMNVEHYLYGGPKQK